MSVILSITLMNQRWCNQLQLNSTLFVLKFYERCKSQDEEKTRVSSSNAHDKLKRVMEENPSQIVFI